jgi:putative tryptophan/tyrosine transport system substrate-binding protein
VLVVYQTPAATAAKAATTELPIVLAAVADPVGGGFVKSLSHPGGNITGVSGASSEVVVESGIDQGSEPIRKAGCRVG